MTAWLKLVPSWAWPWIAALVLALVVGGVQQVRIYGLQSQLGTDRSSLLEANEKLGACRATRTTLLGQVIEQNSAIAGLRSAEQERSAKARAEQQKAEGAATNVDRQAQEVLQEQTPIGADACSDASAAFDNELKRERGL